MRQNIKIATLISYVTLILGNVISIIYTPFMISTLQSSEYGLFSLVNNIISYIYIIDLGLGNAVIRYNSKYMAENRREDLSKINGMFLNMYLIIAMIGIIIGICIYANIGTLFSSGLSLTEIKNLKGMFAISIINLAISFPLNVFNGIIAANEKFVFIKIIALIRTVLNPIIMVYVLLLGYKAIGMVVASTVLNVLIGIVNIIYCFKKLKININLKYFDKIIFKEIFNYSFFIFLSSIAYQIYWSTDQIILGMFVSSASIAIYSIGSQFNSYFSSFSSVISGMFLPKLTKLIHSEKDEVILMETLIKISRIQFLISTFLLISFILVGKEFITLWAGKEYNNSYYIAILLMVPQVISITQSIFATMLEAMNKHRVKSYIYLSVAIINLILSLIFVQKWNAIGCAVATFIGMSINAILNNLYYKYGVNLNISYYWKEMRRLIVPIIISFILGYMIKIKISISSFIGILGFALLFTSIHASILWILTLNQYEKDLILGLMNKFKVMKAVNKL